MSVLSDVEIVAEALAHDMIVNTGKGIEGSVRYRYPDEDALEALEGREDGYKIISYGISSYGYDVRLKGDPAHLRVFSNIKLQEIDPKRISDDNFIEPIIREDDCGAKYVLIPPNSYLQGPTVEYFNIPRDIMVIVVGKSTYARSAGLANVTPIEPGFSGEVVLEVANLSNTAMRCYLEEGIAQFVFLRGSQPCRVSYADRKGKYQGQTGMTYAKV